jgi:hypothetical protein
MNLSGTKSALILLDAGRLDSSVHCPTCKWFRRLYRSPLRILIPSGGCAGLRRKKLQNAALPVNGVSIAPGSQRPPAPPAFVQLFHAEDRS